MVVNLDSYITATQLGITIASLGLGWIGEPAFAGILDWFIALPGWWSPAISHTASTAFSFLIITFLHILLGELAPKSLAIRRPEASTLAIAYPMLWAYRIFYLPMVILNGASNVILKVVGLEAGHPEVAHTAQELRMMLATVPTTEGVTLNRLLLLENIFDLGRQTVKDAMFGLVPLLRRMKTRHPGSAHSMGNPGGVLPYCQLLVRRQRNELDAALIGLTQLIACKFTAGSSRALTSFPRRVANATDRLPGITIAPPRDRATQNQI